MSGPISTAASFIWRLFRTEFIVDKIGGALWLTRQSGKWELTIDGPRGRVVERDEDLYKVVLAAYPRFATPTGRPRRRFR